MAFIFGVALGLGIGYYLAANRDDDDDGTGHAVQTGAFAGGDKVTQAA